MNESDKAEKELGLEAFREPPPEAGLSLDKLNQAFAEMLGGGDDPYAAPAPSPTDEVSPAETADAVAEADEACEIAPRSILEAMLFVGSPDSQPLEAERVAKLMRGVRVAEIDDLVRELNQQYDAEGRPYHIVSEGSGYRIRLRDELSRVRDKFYGKVREARLSTAALEVLSLVAYNGPMTADDVGRLRATPSGAILSQLVARRQLLSVERPETKPRTPKYRTTRRFLELFGLQSLEDLPRSQELDKQ